MMTKPTSYSAYVLWDLKLRGDINETWAHGNATKALRDRMYEHGAPKRANITAVLHDLERQRRVVRIMKGRRTHAIRLATSDASLPVNPYANDEIEVYTKQDESDQLLDRIREMPIPKRMHLIALISATVAEDVKQAGSLFGLTDTN